MLETLDRILPLPYPHFMAFAPLDVWWRLLTRDRAWAKIPARYWVRVAGGLFTSAIGTAITLPERLLLAPLLPTPDIPHPASDIVFVLGYYRSGTTHLHYLLSCDPKLATPRWHQMIAPQGFVLSWTFLRLFLVPFLSSKRPQDDVAYGPEYPAEDDFGVCNWSGSCSLPGRIAVPRCWDFYSRFHSLTGLSAPELGRFRRAQLGISWKLAKLNPGRMLLFKTPSHTARVAELCRLYPSARFIHLHREPGAVVKSNVAMHRRLTPHFLQPHPGDEEIRRRVVEEYDATERKFLAESAAVPADRLTRMRYEDLIADPVGEVQRAYTRLGLELTPGCAGRMVAYLESVRDYRAAGGAKSEQQVGQGVDDGPHEVEWMRGEFGHDRAAVQRRDPAERARQLGLLGNAPCVDPLRFEGGPALQAGRTSGSESRTTQADRASGENSPLLTGPTAALVGAFFCFAAWMAIAAAMHNRLDFLAWPTGVAIGLSALHGAAGNGKRATAALGFWSLSLTLAVILSAAFPATWLAVRGTFSPDNLAHHVWLATRRGVPAWNNLLWIGLGLASAYRFASRQHLRPPGM